MTRPRIFDYVFAKPRTLREDDVWEVTFDLWAHAHGYVTLYRAGRISRFKALVRRSMRRLYHGLKA